MAITYKPVNGEEADAYWREGLLCVYDPESCGWIRDATTKEDSRPSQWPKVQFAILLED